MAKQSKRGALARYLRAYHFAPSYRREQRVSVTTDDGTSLVVHRVPGPPGAPCTVVVVHGFIHWSRTPPLHRFVHELAKRMDVVVPDLRGHGRSGGQCSMGREEPADLERVISETVDRSRPVVSIGISLGGAITLLHASRFGGVSGVVAVSPPAYWGGLTTDGAARIERWIADGRRRRVLAALLRTRVSPHPEDPPSAAAVASAIRDCFVIIASDPDDWYFAPHHAQAIHEALHVDKELWWVPGAGHGTDLLTTGFAARVVATIEARLAGPDRQEDPDRPRPTPSR